MYYCKMFYSSIVHLFQIKSRPCENSLADFCSSTLLKVLKINLLQPRKSKWSSFQKCRSTKVRQGFFTWSRLRMNGCLHFIFSLWQGCRKWGGRGVHVPPPDFPDQLTLYQPEGTDYAHRLLHPPSDFQTFRNPCLVFGR